MNLPTKLENSAYFAPDVVYKINEIISFLEEKFPQSDEPKCVGNCLNVCKIHMGEYQFCSNPGCLCHHKPHWESDYAAIWERYWNEDCYEDKLRQDILELIRKIVKPI